MTNMTSPILQSMTIRAFFRSNGAFWTVRARATIGFPQGLRTHASRASAAIPHRVASMPHFLRNAFTAEISSLGSALRTAFERTNNPIARAVRLFSHGEGPRRLIAEFLGGFQALRSLLPSYPLIPLRQEPTSGRFQRFVFAPVLSSAFNHANTRAWRRQHGVQKNPAPGA